MLVAHMADLHLGRKSPGDGSGAQRLTTLRQLLRQLSGHRPDVVVVAGDLFDGPHVDPAVAREAARSFDQCTGEPPSLPVVILPGNHDPLSAHSLWRAFRDALRSDSAVQLITHPQRVTLADDRLLVDAYPCSTRYSAESPWTERLPPVDDGTDAVHVVVAHGTLQGGPVPEGESDAYPFTLPELNDLDADYVALGHFHSIYPPWEEQRSGNDRRRYSYCGTHETDQFDAGTGTALLVQVEPRAIPHLQCLHTGYRRWHRLPIESAGDLEVLQQLRDEVEREPDPRRYIIRLRLGATLRLSSEEMQQLDDLEASLHALGATVDRRGAAHAVLDVENLDLGNLPSGAIRETFVEIQQELLAEANTPSRDVLAAALQIGWDLIEEER